MCICIPITCPSSSDLSYSIVSQHNPASQMSLDLGGRCTSRLHLGSREKTVLTLMRCYNEDYTDHFHLFCSRSETRISAESCPMYNGKPITCQSRTHSTFDQSNMIVTPVLCGSHIADEGEAHTHYYCEACKTDGDPASCTDEQLAKYQGARRRGRCRSCGVSPRYIMSTRCSAGLEQNMPEHRHSFCDTCRLGGRVCPTISRHNVQASSSGTHSESTVVPSLKGSEQQHMTSEGNLKSVLAQELPDAA